MSKLNHANVNKLQKKISLLFEIIKRFIKIAKSIIRLIPFIKPIFHINAIIMK